MKVTYHEIYAKFVAAWQNAEHTVFFIPYITLEPSGHSSPEVA